MKNRTVSLFIALLIMASCQQDETDRSGLGYDVIDQHQLVEDTAYYSIDMHYPQFTSSLEEKMEALEILNGSVSAFLDTALTYYWGTNTRGVIQIMEETEAAGKYQLINKYEILDTTENLISIKFETYSFALGAHGFTGIHTFNFSLPKAGFLQISDVLDFSTKANTDTLNALLARNFTNPDDCFDNTPTADSSFQRFGLLPDTMVFYYEPYELGAYYCGSAEIKIPVIELKKAEIWKAD